MTEPRLMAGEPPADAWDCHVHVFDAAAPVRPGHYRPAHSPLAEIEALALRHGVRHLVLVQPSVYGTDNSLMEAALRTSPGRHRGVAVVDLSVSDRELDRLHEAGVRGVRFNRVSPAGHAGDAAGDLHRLAPRLRERGWHVQWYVAAEHLPALVPLQAATGLVFVLDHLAGLHAKLPPAHPAWAAAAALAQAGSWIKLSGWYRLQAEAPYAAMTPQICRVASLFGARMVWGSDWPHTSFEPARRPPYDATFAPLREALGPEAAEVARTAQAAALYG